MLDPSASSIVQAIVAYVQDYSFLAWAVVIACELLWVATHRRMAYRGWGLLALAVHNVVFYIVVINTRDGNIDFGGTVANRIVLTSWSAILRAHSGTFFAYLAIDQIDWKKVWERCKAMFARIASGGWPWTPR